MANRFMTRDEVVAELGCPFLRIAVKAAAAAAKRRTSKGDVLIPNLMPDCVPLSIDPASLENGGEAEMLARIDRIEAECRARIARTREPRGQKAGETHEDVHQI